VLRADSVSAISECLVNVKGLLSGRQLNIEWQQNETRNKKSVFFFKCFVGDVVSIAIGNQWLS